MVNIDILNPYLLELKDEDFSLVRERYNRLGKEKAFEKHLQFMNCTRYFTNSNLRIIQTIGYPYKKEITDIIWFVNNFIEEQDKDYYFNKILEQHNENVKFEIDNPPIWYDGKEKRSKSQNSKSTKRTNNNKQNVIKDTKETLTEKRLKQKVVKLNMLNVKLKPR